MNDLERFFRNIGREVQTGLGNVGREIETGWKRATGVYDREAKERQAERNIQRGKDTALEEIQKGYETSTRGRQDLIGEYEPYKEQRRDLLSSIARDIEAGRYDTGEFAFDYRGTPGFDTLRRAGIDAQRGALASAGLTGSSTEGRQLAEYAEDITARDVQNEFARQRSIFETNRSNRLQNLATRSGLLGAYDPYEQAYFNLSGQQIARDDALGQQRAAIEGGAYEQLSALAQNQASAQGAMFPAFLNAAASIAAAVLTKGKTAPQAVQALDNAVQTTKPITPTYQFPALPTLPGYNNAPNIGIDRLY